MGTKCGRRQYDDCAEWHAPFAPRHTHSITMRQCVGTRSRLRPRDAGGGHLRSCLLVGCGVRDSVRGSAVPYQLQRPSLLPPVSCHHSAAFCERPRVRNGPSGIGSWYLAQCGQSSRYGRRQSTGTLQAFLPERISGTRRWRTYGGNAGELLARADGKYQLTIQAANTSTKSCQPLGGHGIPC